MKPESSKLYWIEFIRFIATIAVLLWHYQHFFYVIYDHYDFSRDLQPAYQIFRIFYHYGFFGVQVFWTISGYIFFWKYKELISNKNLDNHINFKKFFILRFSRLYPLHFITFIYVAIIQYFYYHQNNFFYIYKYNDLHHALLNLFMAQNWFSSLYSYNAPSWSVSVEVLIYGLFFLACRFMGKFKALPVFLFIISVFLYKHRIFQCSMFFFLGGSIHYIHEKFKNMIKFFTFLILIHSLWAMSLDKYSFPYLISYLIAFIMLMHILLNKRFFEYTNIGKYVGKVISFLGSITFSIYMLHFPVQLSIATLSSKINFTIPAYNKIFFMFFICITLSAAIVSYFFFEKPVQSLIRKKFLKQ